jgi:hypothetical protein
MYKEVAFDPSCMSDNEYFNLVMQHFGFEKGRYISAETKSWAKEAMAHVKAAKLQAIKEKRVTNYLNKLGKSTKNGRLLLGFLLARDRQGIPSPCWQEWLDEQQKIRKFSYTVASAGCEDRIDIDQINDGCEQWKVPTSISVSRTPKDIVSALYPLLILSEQVTVIDQYFRLSRNPALVELFKAMENTSVRSLRIVTSMETTDIHGVYDRDYRALNRSNIHFKWIKAPDKYFHDRYVITEAGAVRSGQGFMADGIKGAHSDLANINIIGENEASRTLTEVSQLIETGRASIDLSI